MLTSLFLVLGAAALFLLPDEKQYFKNEGMIFGTTYSVQYQASDDLHSDIRNTLLDVDSTLSLFNPESLLSQLNNNNTDVVNEDFEKVFTISRYVSERSNGAFDITVAPLVNAWGFGFKNKDNVTPAVIDSLLPLVGYRSVSLHNHRLVKLNPVSTIDLGAVAKGYACDRVADLLKAKGLSNYLVEIGGEIVAHGQNSRNKHWSVGITRPVDDPSGVNQDIQTVISADSLCMATSGNYRNFYYYNGQRRSHTIDPRTGYPVSHSLLSATVTASSCALADALATACMVLGADSAVALINDVPYAECYLIVALPDENDKQQPQYEIIKTSGW